MEPRFSICIPNYNYASYMDITLASLEAQTKLNFEVLISDNASTDNSVAIIKKYLNGQFPLQYQVNKSNIGFAGNLDKVGEMAKAPWMIMLSSDDVVKSEALEVYAKFINQVEHRGSYAFCSTFEKIDSNGQFIEYISPVKSSIWYHSDIDIKLTQVMGFNVYKVSATEMLRRCFQHYLNPFNFASTCYPKSVYEEVGGYGGGRLYNPDKWFHWKILTKLDHVYYLDNPLFQYRWHNSNQSAQQEKNQILKYWVDEYRNCFEITKEMLDKTKMSRDSVEYSFLRNCIEKPAIYALMQFKIMKALRIYAFGIAAYPKKMMYTKSFFIALTMIIGLIALCVSL